MNAKYIVTLLVTSIGLLLAEAQSSTPIGSNVMVTLTGSGFETESFTYQDGRVDNVSNQVTVDLTFHPSPPQLSGFFFSSISADFSGSIDLSFNITSTEGGTLPRISCKTRSTTQSPCYFAIAHFGKSEKSSTNLK